MECLLDRPLADGRRAMVWMTDRTDGDLSGLTSGTTAAAAADAATSGPTASAPSTDGAAAGGPEGWTWLRQVHGADVVRVDTPGAGRGTEADALVTTVTGAGLLVRVADCVPVAFVAESGAIGVAHAGWKGLDAGVLGTTLAAVDATPDTVHAVVGASIGTECYEFGTADLDRLAARFGPDIIGSTRHGTPALALDAVVGAELGSLGVTSIVWANHCTACHEDRFWSWRARSDTGRQGMLAMLTEPC